MPLVAVAAIAAAGAITSAKMQSSAAGSAANKQTAAANHAADVQGQSSREALDFAKQQAQQEATNAETTRRANYDQWASRERRLGSVGDALGYGGRDIPAYVPGAPASFTTPAPAQHADPRLLRTPPPVGSVGSYLAPPVAPALEMPDPYTVKNVGSYLR